MLSSFLGCFPRCPICGQNSLTANHSVFTLILTQKLLRSPTKAYALTSAAQEGMMLLVWIPIARDYVPKPKKKQKKGLTKNITKRNLSITLSIFPGEFFFGFKAMQLMQVAFVLARQV